MKDFLIFPVLGLFLVASVVAVPGPAFFQLAQTTKRLGEAPVEPGDLPATVGVPSPPPHNRPEEPVGGVSGQELEQQMRYLQDLYRTRTMGSGQQATTPQVVTSSPQVETSSGVPVARSFQEGTAGASQQTTSQVDSGAESAGGIQLSFTDAPIDRVVNAIMTELGHSYVIDPAVAGSVNLFTVGDIPEDRLFEVLEQILKMNGQAIVKQEGLYVVLPIGKSPKIPHKILVRPVSKNKSSLVKVPGLEELASKEGLPSQERQSAETPSDKTFEGDSSSGAEETGPPAETVAAPQKDQPDGDTRSPEKEASKTEGETFGSEEDRAISEKPTSSVDAPGPTILKLDDSQESDQLSGEEGVVTYVIPLHYLPSEDVLQMVQPFVSDGATVINFASANILLVTDYRANIQQVLNLIRLLDTEFFSLNTVELITIQNNQAADVAEDLAKVFSPGDKGGGVRIVAIKRLNSLLVSTHAPTVLQEVKEWIVKLDAPSTNSTLRTYVYEVEKSTAANIAQVLAQLYEDGTGLPTDESDSGEKSQEQTRSRSTADAGFLQQGGRTGSFGGGMMGGGALGPSLTGRPMSNQSTIRAVKAGNVRIIVNEFNNSLIIQSTEADYRFLLQTIRQLDILPRQVLIEAQIYSVELRDDLSFGVAAFLRGRQEATEEGASLSPPTTGSISSASGGGSGGAFSALTRAFIGSQRELESIITALRSRTNVEILEAPRLLAVDGMQASINVGAEVPVTTASFGDPLRSGMSGSFVNSIQFRPTGTTLLIMPRISASGIVTMDMAIEVSSATGQALTPTINRNYVQTSLIVRDGQTVAIAGIISDTFNKSRSRVPILGDIPVIGALFGQTNQDKRRSELIFFITPNVIRSLPTAVEMTLDFKRSLRHASGFIDAYQKRESELIETRREKELELENLKK